MFGAVRRALNYFHQKQYLHKHLQRKEYRLHLPLFFLLYRPGGELNTGEDEVEGLKRLLTEVTVSATSYTALQAG